MTSFLEYSGPLLIREIINYSSKEERDTKTGILLVAGVILSRVFLALLNARSEIYMVLIMFSPFLIF